MALKKIVTIKQSMQHVADNPMVDMDQMLELPAHELVCRTLFGIANGADLTDKPSQSRANVARKLIFDRLVGKRRAGTSPATRAHAGLEFHDLTTSPIGDSDGPAAD
jgi:hypothetical protein